MQYFPIDFVQYFAELDRSLEELSKHQEGKIAKLPSWVLTPRDIRVGVTSDRLGVVIRITPNAENNEDLVTITKLLSTEDLIPFFEPGVPDIRLEQLGHMPYLLLWNMHFYGDENSLSLPIMTIPDLIGFGSLNSATRRFTKKGAKEWAIDLWNNAIQGNSKPGSFVQELIQVFTKFHSIVYREAFLERRIHRFINEYAYLFLPRFRECYFEQPLYLGKKKQVADFILEREYGFPALLIELESPSHRYSKKMENLLQKRIMRENKLEDG